MAMSFLMLFNSCEGAKGDEATDGSESGDSTEQFPVVVREVQRENIIDTIRGNTLVQPIREVTVTSQAGGEVVSAPVSLGQKVNRGTLLLSIERNVQYASLVQARAALVEAELHFNASERLHQSNSISEAEYVQSQSMIAGAKAAVAAAEYQYRICRITAPISGEVATVEPSAEIGNVYGPGMSVCQIVDISKLKVILKVGESQVSSISKSDEVKVLINSTGELFEGEVVAVASAADYSTGSYAVEIEMLNSEDLSVKAGMSANVSILPQSQRDGFVIPVSSKFVRDGVLGVWVNSGSSVVFKPITGEPLNGGDYLVTEGVNDGDHIVLSGISQLTSESVVNATNESEM